MEYGREFEQPQKYKFLCDEWDVKKALRFHFLGGLEMNWWTL